MLILLPPSEGKTKPESGPAVDLEAMSWPQLNRVRSQLLAALIRVSGTRRASEILGTSVTADIEHNVTLGSAPTSRADKVYTGVLFGELDPANFSAAERQRWEDRSAIASALFGLVRPHDLIPAYRMSGSVALPRLGTVASRWKPLVPGVIDEAAQGQLVVDLRSGTYVSLGQSPKHLDTVTLRVLHDNNGRLSVVSHFNKATKGRITRQLITENVEAKTGIELAAALRDLGYRIEVAGQRLDVIVDAI